MWTRAYATWLPTLVCGYLPVCVPVRHGAPFSANKVALTALLASTSVPHPPPCHHLLSLARPHLPAWAGSDGHGVRSIAAHASLRASLHERPGTTPQLRKQPQLCSKRSDERSEDTNSRFWPAENKKEGNARKTRNQVTLRAKRPRAQRGQGHCRRQWKARRPMQQREILNDLDAHDGDTKRPPVEHAKPTRANVPLPSLQQNQPHARVLFAQKKKSSTFNVVFPSDSRALAHVPDADWETPPADECGMRKRGRNKLKQRTTLHVSGTRLSCERRKRSKPFSHATEAREQSGRSE